jgi:superfamily I DNA/RNA helicase
MIKSFSGGAGCGKTWSLMQEAQSFLEDNPLDDDQKILAITFMQGARRRLEHSLRLLPGLNGRYSCETLDSFARQIVARWKSLREHLGLPEPENENFQEACDIAAVLLERAEVVQWVASCYRLIIVDEAQDLDLVRLRVVQALSASIDTLVAADEFQCLDESLTDNPLCCWLRTVSTDVELVVQRRTEDNEILAAASALREGYAVPNGKRTFRMLVTGNAARTADQVNNWLSWYARSPLSAAIITPSLSSYAKKVIELVETTKSAKRNCGPHNVRLESSEKKLLEEIIERLNLPDVAESEQVSEAAKQILRPAIELAMNEWLDRQRRTRRKTSHLRDEIMSEVRSILARQRRSRIDKPGGVRAMTVHGAKNREFDVVIILWPTGMKWPAEYQRRLLYNAVTRAKKFCVIFLQTGEVQNAAPFV